MHLQISSIKKNTFEKYLKYYQNMWFKWLIGMLVKYLFSENIKDFKKNCLRIPTS